MKRTAQISLFIFLAIAFSITLVPERVLAIRDTTYNLWWGTTDVVCTAFAANTKVGLRIITAGHCVEESPATRYYITQGGNPETLYRVNLQEYTNAWPLYDYAIFDVPTQLKVANAPSLCTQPPQLGEAVWSWTGPLGLAPILRAGMYSGVLHFPNDEDAEREVGGMHFVQINGAPGSSGSALLREEKGNICIWGIWVGGVSPSVKLDGALVVNLPNNL